MTTQYTPTLKLALPVQGELSGSWGDVVNDNITSMVEQAVTGLATIDSWTANSHTLTTANGTTSEARCAILELTDTGTALTGAGTVICPDASKLYTVRNSTGQIITLKTASGSGIAIPDGHTGFLYCDATNVVESITSFASDLDIAGDVTIDKTLFVGGTDTANVTAIFQSADAVAAISFSDDTSTTTTSNQIGTTGDEVFIKANATEVFTITDTVATFKGTLSSGDITIAVDDTPTLNFKKASSADVLSAINVTTDAGSGGKLEIQTKRNGNTLLTALTIDDGQDATFAGTINGRDVATDGTKLDGIEASADVTDTANVTSAGAAMLTGGTFTGDVTVNTVLNVRSAIDLADNDILRFGTGDDFEMFCNGSHMYFDLNSGIGNLYIRDGSTTRFTFDDAGSFTATSNITAYSDRKLKDNLEVIPNALGKVSQLTGYTYDRIDMDGVRQSGLIAQDVQEVLPEVIVSNVDPDSGEETLSLAYGNMIGLLVEAVKELKAEVEELKGNQ